jgi:hypothetical protein
MNVRQLTTAQQEELLRRVLHNIDRVRVFCSQASKALVKSLKKNNLSLSERLTHLEAYMANEANSHRNLASIITVCYKSVNIKIANDLIAANDFDAAYANISEWNADNSALNTELIVKSVVAGQFKQEYANHWNMSKEAYRKNYIKSERGKIFNRSFDQHPVDFAGFTLGTSVLAHIIIKSPFSFFSYKSRKFNDKEKVLNTLNLLNTMINFTTEQKDVLLSSVVATYDRKFSFNQSVESKTLIYELRRKIVARDINAAWEAMVKYMVENKTVTTDHYESRVNVSSNNGKRLYNIITAECEKAQAAIPALRV